MAKRERIQISVDPELLERVDKYAEDNFISRSGVFSLGAVQLCNQSLAASALVDLSVAFKKIADTGKFDDEVIQQLENFERIASYLTSGRK